MVQISLYGMEKRSASWSVQKLTLERLQLLESELNLRTVIVYCNKEMSYEHESEC